MMKYVGYIYLHKSPSGKYYIGQTTENPPDLRWSRRNAYSRNSYFSAAIEKYGWENFEHEILEEASADTPKNLVTVLNDLEPKYMLKYNSLAPNGYNIQPGGSNAPCAEETKQKISQKLKGRPRSAESIQKQIEAQRGRIVSEETREKLRAIHTGRVMSAEAREKMRLAALGNSRRKGTKTSEQGIVNMRTAQANRAPMSEETRQKIGAGNRGKTISAEARKRISEGHKGLVRSAEHVQHLYENNGTRGKRRITDGINNKFIDPNSTLPDGWRYGYTKKHSKNT